MVEGVEVKVPSFFWPVTCFVMFLASMNPLVKLQCFGENCKEDYVSELDGQNYTDWMSANNTWNSSDWDDGSAWLQARGNLTMFRLTHGYVNCEDKCNDCGDEDDCYGWNYTAMIELDNALHRYNSALPSFLTQMCNCADFCEDKCQNGLIALPGNKSMNAKWMDMDCKNLEEIHNATESGQICGLVNLYRRANILFILTLVLMILLQLTMLGLEYVNFDSFLDGKCRWLFCPYWVKKILYIFLAFICLGAQLFIYIMVREETDDKLKEYFKVIDGNFNYDWNTRGHYLFITAIVGSFVTLVTMVFFMPKVERQKKKSYRNDIHGISTESVLARKF